MRKVAGTALALRILRGILSSRFPGIQADPMGILPRGVQKGGAPCSGIEVPSGPCCLGTCWLQRPDTDAAARRDGSGLWDVRAAREED
jgi:hypothetical protein